MTLSFPLIVNGRDIHWTHQIAWPNLGSNNPWLSAYNGPVLSLKAAPISSYQRTIWSPFFIHLIRSVGFNPKSTQGWRENWWASLLHITTFKSRLPKMWAGSPIPPPPSVTYVMHILENDKRRHWGFASSFNCIFFVHIRPFFSPLSRSRFVSLTWEKSCYIIFDWFWDAWKGFFLGGGGVLS